MCPTRRWPPLAGLWQNDDVRSVVCTNEGSAVAMAAGWALSSGGCPLVYLQNSGLANALNPLLSLAHPEVTPVGLVLLIGLRGWPGDEPQHRATSRATTALLRAADIPFLEPAAEGIVPALRRARAAAVERGAPVAVLVPRLTGPSRPGPRPAEGAWSSRDAVRAALAAAPPGRVIVSSTGYNTRYVDEFRREHPDRFPEFVYCVGAMGHAGSVAQGIALARPSAAVLCIDGDGGALMHLGALLMPGGLGLTNYAHVVVNNASHESVGGDPTLGRHLSFARLTRNAVTLRGPTTPAVEATLRETLAAEGPTLIELLAEATHAPPPSRPAPPFQNLKGPKP